MSSREANLLREREQAIAKLSLAISSADLLDQEGITITREHAKAIISNFSMPTRGRYLVEAQRGDLAAAVQLLGVTDQKDIEHTERYLKAIGYLEFEADDCTALQEEANRILRRVKDLQKFRGARDAD